MASFLASSIIRQASSYGSPCLAAAAVVATSSASTTTTSSSSSTTTACEEAPPTPSKLIFAREQPETTTTLRRSMTAVGKFSLYSESPTNLSIPVSVIVLSGSTPFTSKQFKEVYQASKVADRHDRLECQLNKNETHFIPKSNKKNDNNISKHASSSSDSHVKDTVFPLVYRKEVQEWVRSAMTEPLSMKEGQDDASLWQVEIATGGQIGQSGAISKARSKFILQNEGSYSGNANNESSTPNNNDKTALPIESLLCFRSHHCLGDGISLGQVFMDFMDEAEYMRDLVAHGIQRYQRSITNMPWLKKFQIFIYYWVYGSIRALSFQFYLHLQSMTSFTPSPWKVLEKLYQENSKTTLDKNLQRSISWCEVAPVEEVKLIARHIMKRQSAAKTNKKSKHKESKITINDIFCSCIHAAVMKQVEMHRHVHPNGTIPKLSYFNMVVPVHLQGGILFPDQPIGNKIGAWLCSLSTRSNLTPLERLQMVHDQFVIRKQTPAAHLSNMIASFFGTIGGRWNGWTSYFFAKSHANASVVVTNLRFPQEPVHIQGHQVQAVLGFLPLPPGVPIGVAVSSYSGSVVLTVAAETWAVPNADLFLTWVLEEYQTLLAAAKKEA